MTTFKKRFLYDDHQHPVMVLLDYDEWLKVEAALGNNEAEANGHSLNRFVGKIDFGGDAVEIQKAMRSEWPD